MKDVVEFLAVAAGITAWLLGGLALFHLEPILCLFYFIFTGIYGLIKILDK